MAGEYFLIRLDFFGLPDSRAASPSAGLARNPATAQAATAVSGCGGALPAPAGAHRFL
ncbi:hypothetical protein GLA29479_247 [Lysobacter antibioticus]|nr:hypothetical protein GLA29479_247 [Lysobacter antibioticus]